MFDFDTPREAKRFRVNHPNGYVEINVGTFFGASPQKKVNKLLRLARKYCTEDQRRGLLCNIVEEAKYRSDILDELDSLISKGRLLFHAISAKRCVATSAQGIPKYLLFLLSQTPLSMPM